ncbi:TolC family protein [Sphingomonas crocodyli]|uniref:TolC family protein n=1 Tax=Sphingomonas crocodyli TaxID=1979270 RepID=UPI0013E2FC06|nr:TolC family protein [Sphingomonas crocodyli]
MSAPLSASPAQTLTNALQAALQNDLDWLGAQEGATAAAESDEQAKALFRPKARLVARAGFTDFTARVTLPAPVQDIDRLHISGSSLAGSVQIAQPLIDGEASAEKRRLRAAARSGEAERGEVRQKIILKVASAYFAVLSARDTIAAAEALKQAAEREARAAQARFDAGRARITDVREAQAEAYRAAAQLVSAQIENSTSTARFEAMTGSKAVNLQTFRDDAALYPPLEPQAYWQDLAQRSSYRIAIQNYQLDSAVAYADSLGWLSRMKLEASGTYEVRDVSGRTSIASIDRYSGYMAGVQLTMPIYSGGALESRQRQAQALARRAQRQLESVRQDVRLEVGRAYTQWTGSVQQAEALRLSLDAALLREKAALTSHELGMRTQADVLAAIAQVIQIRFELQTLFRQYMINRLALYAAAGKLHEEQLTEIEKYMTD